MPSRYPELDEIDQEFSRALAADPEPLSNTALFWQEGLDFEPEIPRVRTRGDYVLMYQNGHKTVGKVPGPSFETGKRPADVCCALMTKHAASPDGPRMIAFRYERAPDASWAGGYSIETQQQFEALVKARRPLDAKFTEALRKHFTPDVDGVTLRYGAPSWQDPGPQLVISKVGEQRATFNAPDSDLRRLWDELLDCLKGHRVRHLYSVTMSLDKPKSRLREGDNLQLLYSR
jgi:hypothetical protein